MKEKIMTALMGTNINNIVLNCVDKLKMVARFVDEKIDDGIYSSYDEYEIHSIDKKYNRSLFDNFTIINLKDAKATYHFFTLYDAYIVNETLYFLTESKYNEVADQKENTYDFTVVLENKYLDKVNNVKILYPYGAFNTVTEY